MRSPTQPALSRADVESALVYGLGAVGIIRQRLAARNAALFVSHLLRQGGLTG